MVENKIFSKGIGSVQVIFDWSPHHISGHKIFNSTELKIVSSKVHNSSTSEGLYFFNLHFFSEDLVLATSRHKSFCTICCPECNFWIRIYVFGHVKPSKELLTKPRQLSSLDLDVLSLQHQLVFLNIKSHSN